MDDKIKVLIASVLKPADDVRSCFKIGQSLAQTNKYEVNIIGFDSKKKAPSQNIFLHPVFKFKRNSWKRLFAPFKVLQISIKLRPQLTIVNTPELLWVMILIKILFGTKIIYDIQENYSMNIRYSNVYKGLGKTIALLYIRSIENLSKHFISGYFLAEAIYEKQLHFIHSKHFIRLLNKTILPIKENKGTATTYNKESLRFIYSGTIGYEYGTIKAVEFCKELYKSDQNITLTIIGYSSDHKYLKEIKDSIINKKWINLITANTPIAQSDIITEIQNSDIALLPYQLNPNISQRFPTKIYDYLALQKPMAIPLNCKWEPFLDQFPAGIPVDFQKPDIKKFKADVTKTSFYLQRPDQRIQWISQESKLLHFVEKILSK